jgi:hypothetical protein
MMTSSKKEWTINLNYFTLILILSFCPLIFVCTYFRATLTNNSELLHSCLIGYCYKLCPGAIVTSGVICVSISLLPCRYSIRIKRVPGSHLSHGYWDYASELCSKNLVPSGKQSLTNNSAAIAFMECLRCIVRSKKTSNDRSLGSQNGRYITTYLSYNCKTL